MVIPIDSPLCADVYALGATLFELASGGDLPFGEDGILDRVVRPSRAPRLGDDAAVDELIQAMTAVEPSARPTAADVVKMTETILQAAR